MHVDWTLFFSAVALAFILEAVPYILIPERMQKVLGELAKGSPAGLRRYGLAALCGGLFLLAVVRGFPV